KEKLLDGTLAIRKVELERLRLRVLRTADGRWNLAGILGPVDLNMQVPTVVIRHSTILVEDRQAAPGALPLEIKDVSLTLINDPITTIRFDGNGTAEAAGPVQVSGTYQRATDETVLAVKALAVPVGPPLVQRLAAYCPDAAAHARQLEGAGKLEAEFSYHPGAPQPWSQDIRCQLSQGRLRHARLPVPLEQIEASLHWQNGQLAL